MSKETLDQFIQKVTDDEQLQARIGEEIDIDSLIALGAEHGCEFTADDLTAGAELSDEELDSVAGGAPNVVYAPAGAGAGAGAQDTDFDPTDTGRFPSTRANPKAKI